MRSTHACHQLDDAQCWAVLLEHDHGLTTLPGTTGTGTAVVPVGYAPLAPGVLAVRCPDPDLADGARLGARVTLELSGAGRSSSWTVLVSGVLRELEPDETGRWSDDVPSRGPVVTLHVDAVGGCEALLAQRGHEVLRPAS
ncbi:hypothetical protein [Nocardioides bruguierae]|uniref:Pyridoxamine 5'-phosphate oxidase family protein n=1 Tax=Nocardioides bruguierae TaxID=2945102 RepID=A0A9X2IF38_9ACTN|nr:hypothetical protein [Nocardioides bruguierae]MCM0620932.1 hypothetical protein [Nocardioides bruguierae]